VHLSDEELSEVAEGRQGGAAGGAEPAGDVAGHLRDCAQCRSEVAAMTDLLDALADLEQPALPPNVALRIDAVLAEAAGTRADNADAVMATAAVPAPDGPKPTDPAVPVEQAHTRLAPPDSTAPSSRASDGSATSPSHRHPPNPLPHNRRPTSRRSSGRRAPRRTVGWVLASVTILGGVVGLAAVLLSSPGRSTAGVTSSAAHGAVQGAPENPFDSQNGGGNDSAPAQSLLASWTKTTLADTLSLLPEPNGASADAHARALTAGPVSSLAATDIAQCLADPAEKGRQVLATTYGEFLSTPSVLVVYVNGDDPSSVYAVAFQAPCASTGYRVLAEGAVPK
jgi:hypothetical protein